MSYELLILPKSWIFAEGDPKKFDVLTKVINKGYSKPMHRYGIIQSPRIKNPDKFMDSLQITEEKECFIAILLGTPSVFSKIESETGYKRNFHYDLYPLSTSINSDIPRDLKAYFGPLLPDLDVEIKVANAATIIDHDIADRIVAVCGFKTSMLDNKIVDGVALKAYELTSFVSFLSGSGPELLNYTLTNFLSDPNCQFVNLKDIERCVVLADVIREHDLVPYYIKKCEFDLEEKPDICIPQSGENSPLEDGIVSSQDFHISFLRREITIRA